MGSATPDMESQYKAKKGEWHYLHLPDRILAHRQAVEQQLERFSLGSSASQYQPLEHQVETIELPPVRVEICVKS